MKNNLRRTFVYFGLLFLIMMIAIAAINHIKKPKPSYPETQVIHDNLINFIHSDNRSIRAEKIAKFNWENVCVLPPYVSQKVVDDEIGVNYKLHDKIDWINNEEYWTLLFLDKNNNIFPIKINRLSEADFYMARNQNYLCMRRDDVQINIKVVDSRKIIFLDRKVN